MLAVSLQFNFLTSKEEMKNKYENIPESERVHAQAQFRDSNIIVSKNPRSRRSG